MRSRVRTEPVRGGAGEQPHAEQEPPQQRHARRRWAAQRPHAAGVLVGLLVIVVGRAHCSTSKSRSSSSNGATSSMASAIRTNADAPLLRAASARPAMMLDKISLIMIPCLLFPLPLQ